MHAAILHMPVCGPTQHCRVGIHVHNLFVRSGLNRCNNATSNSFHISHMRFTFQQQLINCRCIHRYAIFCLKAKLAKQVRLTAWLLDHCPYWMSGMLMCLPCWQMLSVMCHQHANRHVQPFRSFASSRKLLTVVCKYTDILYIGS